LDTTVEIGGCGAGHEVAVGIVPSRQLDDAGGYADIGEALCKPVRGMLASLVFILIKDKIDQAVRSIGKLMELRRSQVGAKRAGGVAKARLPQHCQVEQAFDQDSRWEIAD
jgi:hypothetical protein